MMQAFSLQPLHRNIVQDTLETLMKAAKYEECVNTFNGLNEELKRIGKLQYCKAYALTKLKRFEEAKAIVNPEFSMDDIKEGDISIADLWYELYGAILRKEGKIFDGEDIEKAVEKYYPLGDLDFRMHTK